MTGMHLGALDGPILLFGGPYGNFQATEALRQEAERLGVPASWVICTGDLAAYCAAPQATVDLIHDWGIHVVMGNCEESLGFGSGDCGCGFAEGSACDRLSRAWYAHAEKALSAEAKAWMRTLPRRIDFSFAGLECAVVHGGVHEISRFIFPSSSDGELSSELDAAGTDVVIAGHCGIPFTRRIGARTWHNPGVIGIPANDGQTSVWFSLLSHDGRTVQLSHQQLVYAHEKAASRMREEGLPEGYARALETGLWPSLDVLPEAEQAVMGQPLALETTGIRMPQSQSKCPAGLFSERASTIGQ